MYPNLFYACKDLLGLEIPFLHLINTSGFFIALSIVVAAAVWKKDLKRKQAAGELMILEKEVVTGKPVTIIQLLISGISGFIFGYKIIGWFISEHLLMNALHFIVSLQGNWTAGIITSILFMAIKWAEKKVFQLPVPEAILIKETPADWVTRAAIAAAISGVLGCKLFSIFENWASFKANPLDILLSANGFTFYGGLILATITMWLFHWRWGKYRMRIADAMAPGLMLGYAVGRTGCQLSGDGDWGIINSHPKPFKWLPDWLWAYDYPHNVLSKGIFIQDCQWGNYCYHLSTPVYPTPVYEIIISLILFAILWSIRKRFTVAGKISALYLVVNGIERFFIEYLRTGNRHIILGQETTEAQLIALLYIVAGLLLYHFCSKLNINKQPIG